MKINILICILLISTFVIGQDIWEPIEFPDSLTITAINAEKEGLLIVAAENDEEFNWLFRSYDDGQTWETLDIEYPLNTASILSIVYSEEGTLYLGSNLGFLKSADDGNTLEIISIVGNGINEIRFSPNNDIYGLGWAYLVRSSDGCITWDTLIYSHWGHNFSDIDFGLNGEIYVASKAYQQNGTGFYRSTDNGETWVNTGITEMDLSTLRVNSSGILVTGAFAPNEAFTSSDQGTTWNYVSDIDADVMESYADDKLIVGAHVNTNSGCWLSEDWGNTWIDLVDSILNPNVQDFSISPSNTVYIRSQKSSSFNHQLFKSINPLLKIEKSKLNSIIKLFPNPTNSKITVSSNNNEKLLNYIIYNLTGQKVQSGNYVNSEIDVSKLRPGLYIIELEFESRKARKRIIIE